MGRWIESAVKDTWKVAVMKLRESSLTAALVSATHLLEAAHKVWREVSVLVVPEHAPLPLPGCWPRVQVRRGAANPHLAKIFRR